MQGIVTLHSGETAGVRTRASAIDDNAQSAATAVMVRIKILAPEICAKDGQMRQVQIAQVFKPLRKNSCFAASDTLCFIATGGENEA